MCVCVSGTPLGHASAPSSTRKKPKRESGQPGASTSGLEKPGFWGEGAREEGKGAVRTKDGAGEGGTRLPTPPQKRGVTPPLPKVKEDEVVVLGDEDVAVGVGGSEAGRGGSRECPVRIDDVPAADAQQPLPRNAEREGERGSERAHTQGERERERQREGQREGGRERPREKEREGARSRSPHLPRHQGGGGTRHNNRDTPRTPKGKAIGPSQHGGGVDADGSATFGSSHRSSSPGDAEIPMSEAEEGLVSTSSFLRAALAQIAEAPPGVRDQGTLTLTGSGNPDHHSFYTGTDSQKCSLQCLCMGHVLGY